MPLPRWIFKTSNIPPTFLIRGTYNFEKASLRIKIFSFFKKKGFLKGFLNRIFQLHRSPEIIFFKKRNKNSFVFLIYCFLRIRPVRIFPPPSPLFNPFFKWRPNAWFGHTNFLWEINQKFFFLAWGFHILATQKNNFRHHGEGYK